MDNVPAYRLFFSRGASFLYRLLVQWNLYTWTALFRAYRRDVVRTVPFSSTGFLAGTEILVNAIGAGYRAAEYPTVLHSRVHGVSKAKIARTVRAHLGFQASVLKRRLFGGRPAGTPAAPSCDELRPPAAMNRRQFLALSAASAAIGAGCRQGTGPALTLPVTTPATALTQTLLIDAGGRVRFGVYLQELMGVEGMLGVRRVDPSVEAPAVLASVPSAIVYGSGLSPAWVEALDAFVVRGGTLATVEADAALLARFGVEELGTLPDSYSGVRIEAADAAPLRLHVVGRRWRLSGAVTIATFYADGEGSDLPSPAAVTIGRGAGVATCWAFDLPRNVAFIRQGNPQLVNAERDGSPEVRFVDNMFGWVRPDVLERPDADLYMRALSAGSPRVLHCRRTAPRRRLFPLRCGLGVRLHRRRPWRRGRRARSSAAPGRSPWRPHDRVLRATRDGGMAALCPARAVVGELAAGDRPAAGKRARPAVASGRRGMARSRPRVLSASEREPDLETGLAAAWQQFEDDGYGTEHASTRTHGVVWKDWVGNPQVQRAYGVRMNLDVYQVGPVMRRSDGSWSHGHLVGSGFPARFVEENGDVIDCYQQPTQVLDEQFLAAVGGPEGLSGAGAAAVAAAQLAHALTKTPAALCGVFHIDSFVPAVGRDVEAGAFVDGMLAAFRDAGVPVWPVGRWLRFLDGRRDTAVASRIVGRPATAPVVRTGGQRCRRARNRDPRTDGARQRGAGGSDCRRHSGRAQAHPPHRAHLGTLRPVARPCAAGRAYPRA